MTCCDDHIGVKRWIPNFAGFTEFTASIPKLYFDVRSQEQRILALCKQLHKLICYADYLGGKINVDHNAIEELEALFEKFMDSGFNDYYAAQIEAWIDANMERIMSQAVRQVYFGLTLDGYFIAYIPDSWDDVVFDTGFVYGEDTYGRLILRWDVDNSNRQVNQRPENWR